MTDGLGKIWVSTLSSLKCNLVSFNEAEKFISGLTNHIFTIFDGADITVSRVDVPCGIHGVVHRPWQCYKIANTDDNISFLH